MRKNSESFKQFIINYWNYYRELENELLSVRKYVDFQEGNFNTYSIEFLKLYQAICSEIDVIGKAMAHEVNQNFKPEDTSNNILKWWYEIQSSYHLDKDDIEVNLSDNTEWFMDLFEISPWRNFVSEKRINRRGYSYYTTNDSIPSWWSEYNKVKHNRTLTIKNSTSIYYTKANLKNVCYALAALYTLEIAYMHYLGTQDDLEAFADDSPIFVKQERSTTSDINEFFCTSNMS